MSLGALHLQAACLGASFQRMFEYFIHKASTPSTAFLKLLSVSACKAIWKPHSRAVRLILPGSSYGQVAAPATGWHISEVLTPWGHSYVPVCVDEAHTLVPLRVTTQVPGAALRTGPG